MTFVLASQPVHDCKIFAILGLTFVCSSNVYPGSVPPLHLRCNLVTIRHPPPLVVGYMQLPEGQMQIACRGDFLVGLYPLLLGGKGQELAKQITCLLQLKYGEIHDLSIGGTNSSLKNGKNDGKKVNCIM